MYCFGRPLQETPLAVKEAAVEDYRIGVPLKVIAEKYGFTPATISIWAKVAKVKRRKRGIQNTAEPSERDRAIIRLAREIPIGDVAKEFRMTRARVWSIRNKWRKAGWSEPLKWKVGDRIEWAGETLTVQRVDDEKQGAVKTDNGKVVDPFYWKFQGRIARLLAANHTAAKRSATPKAAPGSAEVVVTG